MSTLTTPRQTVEQRRAALIRANQVRCARAQLKQDIRDGRALGVSVLADPPELAESMRVFDVLLAIPLLGQTKARRVMQRARVSSRKPVRGLTPRQCSELIRCVNESDWQSTPRYPSR